MANPYLYHWYDTFGRSHNHARSIAWKEVQDAGFQAGSNYGDWVYFFSNADTLVTVSNVPTAPDQTFTHVLATSITQQPAEYWAGELMRRIRESRLTPID